MEDQGSEARVRGKPLDGPVSRYINRKVSMRITGFILRHQVPVTPGQISVLSFLMAAACLPLLYAGHLWIAGILAQLASIIDGVDGELARARGLASRRGGFLDSMLDRYADILVLGGLAAYGYKIHPGLTALVLALAAVTGDLMVSYLHARSLHDLETHPALESRLGGIAGRDVRIFVVFLGCLAGRPLETLGAVGLLSHAYVAYMALLLYSRSGGGEVR